MIIKRSLSLAVCGRVLIFLKRGHGRCGKKNYHQQSHTYYSKKEEVACSDKHIEAKPNIEHHESNPIPQSIAYRTHT